MNPAFSVIFFTTLSGAGYGLLFLLGMAACVDTSIGNNTYLVAGVCALVLVTSGLLISTFHLGHPERAWRALSQWRTSWLSREGVCAIFTYIPALAFLWSCYCGEPNAAAGIVMALSAAATVFTTSMIYTSLRSIDAWHNSWVPVNYATMALASGSVLLSVFMTWLQTLSTGWAIGSAVALIFALGAKVLYWRAIANKPRTSSSASAIGAGANAAVKMSQAPHSQKNYLQNEMGFQIARKHAQRLRKIALSLGFVAPATLCLLSMASGGLAQSLMCTFGLALLALGLLVERWLFFAEAEHSVSLYYA